jgi:Cys-tRNA(Pro)/Cys-tRNA(Cys) deacylase
MAKEKDIKTNAMRILDRMKISYEVLTYEVPEFVDGVQVADIEGVPHETSFKTLVAEGRSGSYFVFVIPIEKEVDLKAAARAVGEKSVELIHVKDITKITGYVRGGCSPLGMKKAFPTLFLRKRRISAASTSAEAASVRRYSFLRTILHPPAGENLRT